MTNGVPIYDLAFQSMSHYGTAQKEGLLGMQFPSAHPGGVILKRVMTATLFSHCAFH